MKHVKQVTKSVPAQANILTWPAQVKAVWGDFIEILNRAVGTVDFDDVPPYQPRD